MKSKNLNMNFLTFNNNGKKIKNLNFGYDKDKNNF